MSPAATCMRLANSCRCTRSAAVIVRTVSSLSVSAIRSVRSRMINTSPRERPSRTTGLDSRYSTRSSTTAVDRSRSPVTVSSAAGGSPRPVRGRPIGAVRPSIRSAASLLTRTMPAVSTASTPSSTPLRTAVWFCTSAMSSSGCTPSVRRSQRRRRRRKVRTARVSAPTAVTPITASSGGRSSKTPVRSNPTLTSPTGVPVLSRTGTFARADSPRVPVCQSTTSLPASTSSNGVLTSSPMREGVGWARRMPSSSAITTKSAPVRSATSVAVRWSSPSLSDSASGLTSAEETRATSARTCGSSASVLAMPRAVDSASARSCWTASAR